MNVCLNPVSTMECVLISRMATFAAVYLATLVITVKLNLDRASVTTVPHLRNAILLMEVVIANPNILESIQIVVGKFCARRECARMGVSAIRLLVIVRVHQVLLVSRKFLIN